MIRRVLVGAILSVLVPASAGAQPRESMKTVESRPGVTQRFVLVVRAPRKELLVFKGGAGGSSGERACGPWAAHGYHGIDDEVVKAIADWITR